MQLVLKVKKLHPFAKLPSYAKPGDAGLDLVANDNGVSVVYDHDHMNEAYREYGTGIAVEIPPGYVGLIFPRSSCTSRPMMLKNCVGVIDSGYRGEIRFRFLTEMLLSDHFYKKGDKIGQLIVMPYPSVTIEEVSELSDSERGAGGYGSSGR